ncbi:hypothetical protein EVAR_75288_1 [Eumeta japonica]|uniref:Uncharacterized protein n=1 Tax=Eumeta variegata TaxID=151549 RepID=A0A4C1YUI0_EUMVA|nr:hypothetical protein EVAR_75288_1 [Eumeta japonica]
MDVIRFSFRNAVFNQWLSNDSQRSLFPFVVRAPRVQLALTVRAHGRACADLAASDYVFCYVNQYTISSASRT